MSENPLHWVAAVAIVNFDLELGQSIEHIEPASFSLTEQERLNICYLAFPDSNSGEKPRVGVVVNVLRCHLAL